MSITLSAIEQTFLKYIYKLHILVDTRNINIFQVVFNWNILFIFNSLKKLLLQILSVIAQLSYKDVNAKLIMITLLFSTVDAILTFDNALEYILNIFLLI